MADCVSAIVIWGGSRLYRSGAHATVQDRPGSSRPPARPAISTLKRWVTGCSCFTKVRRPCPLWSEAQTFD